MIRERGMIPGLVTPVPETIVDADESGLDVETDISTYNALGILKSTETGSTLQGTRSKVSVRMDT